MTHSISFAKNLLIDIFSYESFYFTFHHSKRFVWLAEWERWARLSNSKCGIKLKVQREANNGSFWPYKKIIIPFFYYHSLRLPLQFVFIKNVNVNNQRSLQASVGWVPSIDMLFSPIKRLSCKFRSNDHHMFGFIHSSGFLFFKSFVLCVREHRKSFNELNMSQQTARLTKRLFINMRVLLKDLFALSKLYIAICPTFDKHGEEKEVTAFNFKISSHSVHVLKWKFGSE